MTYKILCPANLRTGFSLTFSRCQPFPHPSPCRSFTWRRHGETLFTSDVCVQNHFSHVRPYGLQPVRLLCPWDSPGENPLEWIAMPSSRGSPWPRDWTCISYVSCIGRQVLKYHPGSPTSGIVLNRSHIDWRTIWYIWVILYRFMLFPCFFSFQWLLYIIPFLE